MRVVAGSLGGRRIVAPDGHDTRPTTDKVREAVFNALQSMDVLVDARVADLFAGSGAIGIEALSRGSVHCTFVERDRRALAALCDNVETLGITDLARIVSGDAMVAAASLDADLVFADPPYTFDAWGRLLGLLDAPFVVLESGRELTDTELVDPADPGRAPRYEITRSRRYGRTWITFLEHAG